MDRTSRGREPLGRSAALCVVVLLAACSSVVPTSAPRVYEKESFDQRDSFSREFVASPADTCNAAERALLSQGYVVQAISPEQLGARKRFQPDADNHVQIEFHVVCSPVARGQPTSVAFVSAVQDLYTLKKTPSNASLGVAPFGSLSLPLSSSSDSLVKVGSETIPAGRFYDRFFDLVEQFLAEQKGLVDRPGSRVEPVGAPQPARHARGGVPYR
jgi:hypothetical protein